MDAEKNYDEIRKAFAEDFRRIRIDKQISQEDLGFDAGLDRAYVSRLEHALLNPTLHKLVRLANALGMTLSFTLTPKPPSNPPPLRRVKRPRRR